MNRTGFLSVGGFLLFLACVDFAARADTPALGRLFFSGEERRELDRLRNENKGYQASELGEKQRALPTESLTINGVVVRGNGKSTFWINGQPVPENNSSYAGIRVIRKPDQPIKVGFPCGSDDIQLKPGQKIICQRDHDHYWKSSGAGPHPPHLNIP